MDLTIRYECPQCNETLTVNLQDFAPGHRKVCTACQTPGRITSDGLERFSNDLRQYCMG